MMSQKLIDEVGKGKNTQKNEYKCIICEEAKAQYYIKGKAHDCYCEECATEYFGDTAYLEKF